MYNVYGFPTQNTKKVLYVAQAVGADYKYHFVDLSKGEQKSEKILSLHPMGKVPALDHDGKALFESGAICRYIANNEGSDLYPQDKYQRAVVDQWMDFFSIHLGRWLSTLFFETYIKPKFKMGETNPSTVEEATNFAHQQLDCLNKHLANSAYLTGEKLTIADLFAYAYLEQVSDIDFNLKDYPHVKKWLDGMAAKETVKKVNSNLGKL